MGRDIWDAHEPARVVLQEADEALGFGLTKLMFNGPEVTKHEPSSHFSLALLTIEMLACGIMPMCVVLPAMSRVTYQCPYPLLFPLLPAG